MSADGRGVAAPLTDRVMEASWTARLKPVPGRSVQDDGCLDLDEDAKFVELLHADQSEGRHRVRKAEFR